MNNIDDLKKELEEIKSRNKRVEGDKAWEISKFRILSITLLTYLIAAIVLYVIGVEDYLIGALVSAVGYFLSTQSLPIIRRWWIKRFFNKHE